MSRVEEIRARLAAADTAEWETYTQEDGWDNPVYMIVQPGRRAVAIVEPSSRDKAVMEFLGSAPADIAWLIAEHHRLQARIAYLEGWKERAEESAT